MKNIGSLVRFWEPDNIPSAKSVDCFEHRVLLTGIIVSKQRNHVVIMRNGKFYTRPVRSVLLLNRCPGGSD